MQVVEVVAAATTDTGSGTTWVGEAC
jgi:hypothetical protein